MLGVFEAAWHTLINLFTIKLFEGFQWQEGYIWYLRHAVSKSISRFLQHLVITARASVFGFSFAISFESFKYSSFEYRRRRRISLPLSRACGIEPISICLSSSREYYLEEWFQIAVRPRTTVV